MTTFALQLALTSILLCMQYNASSMHDMPHSVVMWIPRTPRLALPPMPSPDQTAAAQKTPDLTTESEDGVSTIHYMRSLYCDEWHNMLVRAEHLLIRSNCIWPDTSDHHEHLVSRACVTAGRMHLWTTCSVLGPWCSCSVKAQDQICGFLTPISL